MSDSGARPWRALLLFLLGCADRTQAPADSGSVSLEDEEIPALDAPESVWSLEDVEAQLQHFMDMGVPSGREITEVFEELMSHGEGPCPGGALVFIGAKLGCETPDGYTYAGIAWLYHELVRATDGVPLVWTHGGDFEIIRPDGTYFGGGGDMFQVLTAPDVAHAYEWGGMGFSPRDLLTYPAGGGSWILDVHGSWVDSSREDWLGRGFSGVVLADGTHDLETGERQVQLHGGLAVDDVDVFFDQTTWYGDDRCEQGVVGTLRLRDPRGYWFAWELGEDCDSCGDLTFHEDQPMGELCLDLSDYAKETYTAWSPH